MNKPINHPSLELVSTSSTPTDPPADRVQIPISEAEAELADAVIEAAGRSPAEITALVDAYEKRQRAEREAADAAADWRWWIDPENAPVILCHEQLATAVFVATRGDICFRQQIPGTEDDISVFIRPEHVPALIRRLQQLIK
jgi:hypothetical protein